MVEKKRIVLDCDPGVDDALAIVLALNSGKVDLRGITTVSGNVGVDQTTLNARRLLDYLGADVPVSRGAGRPLRVPPFHAKSVHGRDGLGDSPLLSPASSRGIEPEGAAEFIVRSVESGVRTIVATGPLTNVARAFQRGGTTMDAVEQLVIMGGAVHVPGNVDSLSEFNFYADPDAADYVLQRTGVPKVLVPLDVTHRVVLTSAGLEGISDSRAGRLVKSVFGRFRQEYAREGFKGGPLHDPLAMGYCIDETFLDLRPTMVRVETTGAYTRGACVPEERPWVDAKANVSVALGVDSERFLEYFEEVVSR
ncbi:MAG: nucleoside hydrolase [Nitrososphaerales archaeon]